MSSEEHYEQIIKGLQVQLQAKRQLLKSRDIEVTLLNERVRELEAENKRLRFDVECFKTQHAKDTQTIMELRAERMSEANHRAINGGDC